MLFESPFCLYVKSFNMPHTQVYPSPIMILAFDVILDQIMFADFSVISHYVSFSVLNAMRVTHGLGFGLGELIVGLLRKDDSWSPPS